jgi:hypothetical protein
MGRSRLCVAFSTGTPALRRWLKAPARSVPKSSEMAPIEAHPEVHPPDLLRPFFPGFTSFSRVPEGIGK